MIIKNVEVKSQDLGNGVSRKILAYENELMCVEVSFDTGGIGDPHSHPHVQSSYVESGKFQVTVGNTTEILAKGDSLSVPPDVIHGVICLEKGKLIDFFTPMRKDFLK